MTTKIYFDGACPLCSREMAHYQKKDKDKNFSFIDIASSDFNAAAEGLNPERVNQVMHIKTPDGKLHTGVDAFLQIWKLLPGYSRLVPIANCYGIKQLLEVGYFIFARLRPFLPKRSEYCSIESCKRR